MNFLKKILERFTSKKGSQDQKIYPTTSQTQEGNVVEKKYEERNVTLEKSDEEIINELNLIAPGIFSHIKTPEEKRIIIQIYRKMLEDSVDVKNEKEVKKWMRKNQHLFTPNFQKIETYRREKPKVGRNDPCPCGSGKKYKKCCGKDA